MSRVPARILLAGAVGLGIACATAPKPSAALVAIEKNPKAMVSGTVVDAATGEPVAGIEVSGLPRGKDYPWEPPAVTDALGRFTLALAAPAEYSFLLRFRGISAVTPDPADPGYVDVKTVPGGRIDGIRLQFLRAAFSSP
jgi:hypothetical protein